MRTVAALLVLMLAACGGADHTDNPPTTLAPWQQRNQREANELAACTLTADRTVQAWEDCFDR